MRWRTLQTGGASLLCALVLALMATTGCGLSDWARDKATAWAKAEGIKILAKQVDSLELKLDEKLAEVGVDAVKAKELATEISMMLRGGSSSPIGAIESLGTKLNDLTSLLSSGDKREKKPTFEWNYRRKIKEQ